MGPEPSEGDLPGQANPWKSTEEPQDLLQEVRMSQALGGQVFEGPTELYSLLVGRIILCRQPPKDGP